VGEEGGGKKNKIGPVHGWLATSGCLPAVGFSHCSITVFNFFDFYFYFLIFFGSSEELPGILGEWVYNTPIFLSLPLHFEVLNLPILMEFGDFTFFSIF
jgi:hypothetical protein